MQTLKQLAIVALLALTPSCSAIDIEIPYDDLPEHDYDLPVAIELDLVFPRNNTVYKPEYPFPFVFTLRNANVGWPYDFYFRYEVRRRAEDLDMWETFMRGGFEAFPDRKEILSEELLLFNSTNEFANQTSNTEHVILWDLKFLDNCTKDSMTDNEPAIRTGVISFNISEEHGQEVDFLAGGPCPTLLDTFDFEGSIGGPESTRVCPVIAEERPEGDPCWFQIDEGVSDKVRNAMAAEANCPDGSWPGIDGPCKDSGDPAMLPSFVFGAGAAVAVLGALW